MAHLDGEAFDLALLGTELPLDPGQHTLTAEACPNPVCAPGDAGELDDVKSLGIIADISFVVGAVGRLVGAVGLMDWCQTEISSREVGWTVRPQIGFGSAGVNGSF